MCRYFNRLVGYCTSHWTLLNATLLSDAEGAEDQVKDVVGGGGAGDFVERAQGRVQIEQEHLVRHSSRDGSARGVERGERVGDQLLMPDAGKKAALQLVGGVSADVVQDSGAQHRNAFAGE